MIQALAGKFVYFSTWLGFQLGLSAVKISPALVFWLADRLAAVGYLSFRGFRERSLANLRLAFGDRFDDQAIDLMARRSLRNFFRACVETVAAINMSDEQLRRSIPVNGQSYLDAARARGRGVLLLSAHLGNFFLLGTRLAAEGYTAFVLVNQPRDGRFARLMDDYRLRVRQPTIHARPRNQALRELHEVLRRNQIVIVIADEFRRGSGIEVPFFGGTVVARRGPVTVALRTGAAILPACLVRQPDDSLQLVIEPELEIDRSAKGAAQIRENTLRMSRWLEQTVRGYPDQWNWMNIRHWVNQREPITDSKIRLRRAV